MSQLTRPDGATIYYEVRGTGFPLLLIAPGGFNSRIESWTRISHINPFDYADEFMVIGMNQRNAERSPGPLVAPTWDVHAADQLAVLDELGVERAHLWGGCVGVAMVLRFIHNYPHHVSAAVGQDAVGYVAGFNGRETTFLQFQPTIDLARNEGLEAVVASAIQGSDFTSTNASGPFAPRLATDEGFREAFLKLGVDEYERLIRAYDEQLWGAHYPFVSVDGAFISHIPVPVLLLPGRDVFHPPGIAERICQEAPNARCLPADCREPQNLEATKLSIRDFLREHAK